TAGVAKSVRAVSQPAAQAPVVQQPAPQQPAPQQAIQQQPPPQQPAAPKGTSRGELRKVRESLALVGVRAAGIRTSLQSVQRSQAASGMNLRGEMQSAANLMNTFLDRKS